MLFNEKRVDFEINGRKGYFSTGKFARKADVAIMAGLGDTVILATVSVGEPVADLDYFPMSVEYVEKMAAAGMVSSSRFVKRERFPSDDAILRARIIDRSMRFMFPEDFRCEVQIIVEVMSFDPENDPTILAINAVSAALLLSKIPFSTPIAGVRIGYGKGGKLEQILNYAAKADRDDEASKMKLNLVIAGDGKNVTNLDADAYELSEEEIVSAMKVGISEMDQWIKIQKKLVDLIKPEKAEYVSFELPKELVDEIKKDFGDRILKVLDISASEDPQFSKTKLMASKEGKAIQEEIAKKYEGKYSKSQLKEAYEKTAKYLMRKLIKEEKRRLDGRKFEQVREMGCEVALLPRVHGSGLFTRGLTQILSTVTLGTIRKQQMIENMTGEDNRSFMHFYSQYPFTMGQAQRYNYNPGRREIGHGALAEKALIPVLPSVEEFPYTIIVSSDIMSENGSSSQGCSSASTLALMDAGVPIKKHVAGIACGVVYEEDKPEEYSILTDIRDLEDFYGFMDFKVAGTRDGITAIQFDTKAKGLPIEIFEKAIIQSKEARLQILDEMYKTIEKPREKVSNFAPKVESMKIAVSKIGELIGPGGKNIKDITEKTGAEVNIEEDGTVNIYANTQAELDAAKARVLQVAFVPVIGEEYKGTVATIMEYGAFVDIAQNVSGLVHVSEMADEFVKDVRKYVTEGQEVTVKVLDIGRDGKIKLSMKAVGKK
ncbi:polyribonucleotide nucleotidyltransferase [Candidatus Dojkabacteria bacterium]|jgi:polyribonucleotide nucleotidyltransferase|nr:polyribonucleotide nucleotidyltransferase [Candidatus Dojkabacteria bacterium]